MGMTVQRRKDTRTPKVLMHRIADIRGGVSVNVTELGTDYLPEGTVLSAPVDGICHVVKVATVAAIVAAAGTEISVKKGSPFKVGDFVMTAIGAKAYAITAIDTSGKDVDKITVGTALGAIEAGAFLVEAAAESADTASALKYAPFAITGTGKPVVQGDNFDVDAWLIGVTKGNALPSFIAEQLKGIINY